jgi:hypothetical protein
MLEFNSPNIEILRLTMMEKLTVDAEGKSVIPPEVIQKRGLHPGDENIREWFTYSYRVIYRIDDRVVTIAAIVHGKRLLDVE